MLKVKFLKALYPFNKWEIGEVEEGTYEMFRNQLELIEEKKVSKMMDSEKIWNKAILKPKKNK